MVYVKSCRMTLRGVVKSILRQFQIPSGLTKFTPFQTRVTKFTVFLTRGGMPTDPNKVYSVSNKRRRAQLLTL